MINTNDFIQNGASNKTIAVKMPDGSIISLIKKQSKQSDMLRLRIQQEKIAKLMPAFQLEVDKQVQIAINALGDNPTDDEIDKAYEKVKSEMDDRLKETIAPLDKILKMVFADADGGDGVERLLDWLVHLSSPVSAIEFVKALTKEANDVKKD